MYSDCLDYMFYLEVLKELICVIKEEVCLFFLMNLSGKIFIYLL